MGRGLALLAVAAAVAGCVFDPTAVTSRMDDAGVDAGRPDASRSRATHLLLTEVKSVPDTGEFIEIYNATCDDVDLSTYYLSDLPSYALLPSWGGDPPTPAKDNALIQFPAGATLAPGSAAVIARDGAAFADEYGVVARFALVNPGTSASMVFVASRLPVDMKIFNDGEPVVLFEWDGASDLVRDVDIVIAGDAPPADRSLVGKQDLVPEGLDGPDDDTRSTLYQPDSSTIPAMVARETNVGSYQRILFERDFETETGGNGIGGHDETSENTRTTWEQDLDTPPTPGAVPATLDISCVGPGS